MSRKVKNLKKKVFFNASVVLAGLHSPSGGSAKVLNWSKKGKIKGIISEVVLDEIRRHADKINLTPKTLEKKIGEFVVILPAPPENIKYRRIVKDFGDIHLFSSSEEIKVDYLVSLDKKHVLSLVKKIKKFKILSPGELIREIGKND